MLDQQELKVPPQNLEAERSVLGAMIIDDEAIGLTIEIIDEFCFYDSAHQKIFATVISLYNNHKNVDLITLSDRLKSENALETVGGVSYLTQLIDSVPTAANVEHYAHIVKEKSI